MQILLPITCRIAFSSFRRGYVIVDRIGMRLLALGTRGDSDCPVR